MSGKTQLVDALEQWASGAEAADVEYFLTEQLKIVSDLQQGGSSLADQAAIGGARTAFHQALADTDPARRAGALRRGFESLDSMADLAVVKYMVEVGAGLPTGVGYLAFAGLKATYHGPEFAQRQGEIRGLLEDAEALIRDLDGHGGEQAADGGQAADGRWDERLRLEKELWPQAVEQAVGDLYPEGSEWYRQEMVDWFDKVWNDPRGPGIEDAHRFQEIRERAEQIRNKAVEAELHRQPQPPAAEPGWLDRLFDLLRQVLPTSLLASLLALLAAGGIFIVVGQEPDEVVAEVEDGVADGWTGGWTPEVVSACLSAEGQTRTSGGEHRQVEGSLTVELRIDGVPDDATAYASAITAMHIRDTNYNSHDGAWVERDYMAVGPHVEASRMQIESGIARSHVPQGYLRNDVSMIPGFTKYRLLAVWIYSEDDEQPVSEDLVVARFGRPHPEFGGYGGYGARPGDYESPPFERAEDLLAETLELTAEQPSGQIGHCS